METFELRYFLEVARRENLHRASEVLSISPGSLSKAIARLESELSTKLFHRAGRNIRLTDQGRLLQRRASEIVHLEQSARAEISGLPGSVHAILVGSEVLLSRMGLSLADAIRKRFASASVELHPCDDSAALARLQAGEAHLAIVTCEVSGRHGLTAKILEEATFRTCAGKRHPLYPAARAKRAIPIDQVLLHPFASPDHPVLGRVGLHQSMDGWRDDQFPRKVEFRTSSLKLLETLVVEGRALAYLPDYFCDALDVAQLKISGCPYSCTQKIKLVARNPKQIGWLNQIF